MPRGSRRIGGPLPGAGDILPAAQLSLQLAGNFGDVVQLGTAISVLRVILDTVQVRDVLSATCSRD